MEFENKGQQGHSDLMHSDPDHIRIVLRQLRLAHIFFMGRMEAFMLVSPTLGRTPGTPVSYDVRS
jgi:hypothetical protein